MTGILAGKLGREALSGWCREALRNGRLALVSPYGPDARAVRSGDGIPAGNRALLARGAIEFSFESAMAVLRGEKVGAPVAEKAVAQ